MDSHVFRILAAELLPLLSGARVQKIHSPAPNITVFGVFAKGERRRLFLRHERQNPLLFLGNFSLPNPQRPSGLVMRLRKYAANRRLGDGVIDYAARSIAFPLKGGPEETPAWLLLDLREGPQIFAALPAGFGTAPPLPGKDALARLCAGSSSAPGDESWKEFTLLTPLLRETLRELDQPEAAALLADLEAGGGDLFAYADKNDSPALLSAWPLPDEVLRRRGLHASAQLPPAAPFGFGPETFESGAETPVLRLASRVCSALLEKDLSLQAVRRDDAPVKKENKRLARLNAKLDAEEKRLRGLLALREDAVRLQEILWTFGSEEKHEEVVLPVKEGMPERRLALNAFMTVRENMARMFQQSDRGARGLTVLEQRRAAVAEESRNFSPAPQTSRPAKGRAGKAAAQTGELKNVARFISSDGFTLLRGKNAEGNHSLMKLGGPHDYWMHAAEGPSAHLIIRRSHAAHEVPERTLMEAGSLVALKSSRRNDAKCEIMLALLRHVHGIKGAKPGTVRVEKVIANLSVPVEQGIEEKLRNGAE